MLFDFNIVAESQNKRQRNPINDFRGSKPVHLLFKDMIKPFRLVGVKRLYLFASEKPFYYFRNVQPRLHIQVGKGKIGIVKAAGIFFSQLIDHKLHNLFGRENLVGFLRRDIIEYIFRHIFFKVICKAGFQRQKFPD